jgi:hypothetical protein
MKQAMKLFIILSLVIFSAIVIFLLPGEVNFLSKTNNRPKPETPDISSFCQDESPICLKDYIISLVSSQGPKKATELLGKLQIQGKIPSSEDFHQIAHQIGRKTAQIFGLRGDAFLACPTSFNYGCQHGFFEYALGRTETPKEAAEKICNSLDPKYSEKFKFYCYHGIGHGVMMARAYRLEPALAICDTFTTSQAQNGCWQGVFMENVNAVLREEAPRGVFSTSDPLKPCSIVDPKYRHECFINHAGWLMKVFKNNITQAAQSCLKAPDKTGLTACLESIGLMVTNPSWQVNLVKVNLDKDNAGDTEKTAWQLCQKFPQEYIDRCVMGGVDNIMNFDELKTERAAKFCSLVAWQYQSLCAERIGKAIKSQVTDEAAVINGCRKLPPDMGKDCLRGAEMSK